LVLITPEHPRHNEMFALVARHMDPDIRADLDRIRSCKRVEDRLRETESTINRLRALLSPITREIFSSTGAEETLDVGRVIQGGGALLWHLRPGTYLSNDQKITLGQLAI